MADRKKKKATDSRKKPTSGLVKAFKKFNLTIKEQSEVGVKHYFKNISKNAVFICILFISLLSFTFLGYYNVFFGESETYFSLNIVKTAFYIPLVTMLCLTLFLVRPKYIFRNLYYMIPSMVAIFTCAYFIPVPIVQFILTAVLGLMYGYIFASMIYIFFFYFNSKEQLWGSIILASFLCCLSLIERIASLLNFPSLITRYIFPVLLIIISFIMLLFKKEVEFDEVEESDEKIDKSNYAVLIALLLFLFINEGIFFGIKDNIVFNGYTLGTNAGILGFFVALVYAIFIYLFKKKANYIMIVSYFLCVVATYQFGIFYLLFDRSGFSRHIFEGALGITSPIGIIALVMTVGKMLEDKKNLSTVRNVGFIVAGCFILSKVISFGIKYANLRIVLVACIFFMVLITIIFMMLNVKAVVTNDQTYAAEVRGKYVNPEEVLTKKEKVVFELLLEGLTLRQIAGELCCKYDAVNFHYKNIYRKLDVNSKIELIMRYGKH